MENPEVDGTSTEIKDPAAVLSALDRAKKDAKEFRLAKEELEKQLLSWQEHSNKVQSKLISEKINKHLAGLGINNSERLMKYIKADALVLNDDLELEGLDEQIDSLKSDFPELFDPKLLVGGKADSADAPALGRKLSASEMQARLVLGK